MKIFKKIIFITGICLSCLELSVSTLLANKGAVNVETQKIVPQNLIKYSNFTGFLEPIHQTQISAEVNGIVASVHVKVGEFVKKGQTLVTISTEDLQIEKDQAQSDYSLMKMIYEKEKELFNTRVKGVSLTGTDKQHFPENLMTQNALLNKHQAQSRYQLSLNKFKREQTLFKKGFSNESKLEEMENRMLTDKFKLQLSNIAYEKTLRESNIALQSAKNKLDAALSRIKKIQRRIDKSIIKASYSAIIGQNPIHQGELISIGTKILTIVDTSLLKALIHIGENNIRKIHKGQIVEIQFEIGTENSLS